MRKFRTLVWLVVAMFVVACETSSDSGVLPTTMPRVLVTGATGTQGGAVARELLDRGFRVRGLTRNPDKPRAVAMSGLGAEMIQGDYDDADSLRTAMNGVDGVFAVTDFWEHGFEREVLHGKQLVDAALAAGVGHFVYSSVAGADKAPDVAHFVSKLKIEDYLRDSGLVFSIIRPVEFMDNWRYQKQDLMAGSFIDPRSSDRKHQWIASRDIGFFVAEAFAQPERWQGQTVEIAGDERTLGELVAIFSSAIDQEIQYQSPSWSEFYAESGEEAGAMVKWFDTVGYSVDVPALRREYPELITVEQFIESLGW